MYCDSRWPLSFCPLKALAHICHSVFRRNLMFYLEPGSSKLFRCVCIIWPCIQDVSNFTFSAAQWRYRPNGSWPPIFGLQQLIYQHLVGALGGGIGPSLGVYLRRTTQKTSIPRVRIRTAEPFVRAVENRRLGHWDQLKTRIAIFHILWTVQRDTPA